jgi:hypothetical protein
MTVALVPSRSPAATTSTRYPGIPELPSPPPVHADTVRRNQPQARYPTEASTTQPRRVAQARTRMIVQPKAVCAVKRRYAEGTARIATIR